MKGNIKGFIPAPYIPFDEKGQIMEDALGEHIDFLIKNGADALYSIGSTGEFHVMPLETRKKVAEVVVKQTRKRAKVVIHIAGGGGTPTAIELAKHAEDVGADALYCVPPYYYTPDKAMIIEYYRAIAQSVKIPLHIYNIPSCTFVNINVETMIELSRIQGITAVKDSAGDIMQLKGFIEMTDLDVFVGLDQIWLTGLMLGAVGIVSGFVGPIFPEIVRKFYDSFMKGNLQEASELQNKIRTILKLGTYEQNATVAILMATAKEALELRGFKMGKILPPLRQLTKAEKNNLKRGLKNLKLI